MGSCCSVVKEAACSIFGTVSRQRRVLFTHPEMLNSVKTPMSSKSPQDFRGHTRWVWNSTASASSRSGLEENNEVCILLKQMAIVQKM